MNNGMYLVLARKLAELDDGSDAVYVTRLTYGDRDVTTRWGRNHAPIAGFTRRADALKFVERYSLWGSM